MKRTALAAGVLAALPACVQVSSGCTSTRLEAEPADKVDVRAVGRSSVLTAELLAGDAPVPGKTVVFEVRADGATMYEGEARTDRSGVARYDLKRVDRAALVALARAESYQASFDGDATYCPSSDEAAFKLLNT